MLRQIHDALVLRQNWFLMWVAFWAGARRRKGSPKKLKDARRIVAVCLEGIGDVVMTTPFLRELRRNCPAAHIQLVVSQYMAPLMDSCPYVDDVIGFNTRVKWPPRQLVLFLRACSLGRRLRRSRVDWVLLPRTDLEGQGGGLICLLSGAVEQAVFSEKTTPARKWFNRGHDRFYSRVLTSRCTHEIDRNLDMLRQLGLDTVTDAVELWVEPKDREALRRKWGLSEPLVGPLVAVCAGAAQPEKVWPADLFCETLKGLLLKVTSAKVLLLGGRGEVEAGAHIVACVGGDVLDLTGKTTLTETAALLEMCDLCVGNDTGALHIASAVGTAQIMICGFPLQGAADALNSPARFGPRLRTRIIQPPKPLPPCTGRCEARTSHCIRQVRPPEVLDAMVEALGYASSRDGTTETDV